MKILGMPVVAFAVAACAVSCAKITHRNIASVEISKDKNLNIYVRGYPDAAILGIEIKHEGRAPEYYLLGMSSQGEYPSFKAQVKASSDKNRIWINGIDSEGARLLGFFDFKNHKYIDEFGVVIGDSSKIDVPISRQVDGNIPKVEAGSTVILQFTENGEFQGEKSN